MLACPSPLLGGTAGGSAGRVSLFVGSPLAALDVTDSAARLPASTMSDATDLPAAATPLSTPTALLSSPMVSEMAVVDTRPARSVSSTPSVNRWKIFADDATGAAYFDSRNSI